MQDLAAAIRRRKELNILDDEKDDDLFSEFLPQSSSSTVVLERPTGSLKRVASEVLDLGKIPRKSKVPALASLTRIAEICDDQGTSKKRVLLTREKLRAGLHDPRGLLDLVGPSTNALERTKRLEMLKSLMISDLNPFLIN